MSISSNRRALLKAMTAHGGLWATRSLATGLPVSLLMGGLPSEEAIAAEQDAQFLLMALNHTGEPINNNCPGVYDTGVQGIHHNKQNSMKPTSLSLGSQTHRAAKPWADFANEVPWAANRTTFIHHDTRTNIHAQYSGVMKLMGSSRGPNSETNSPEFLPSILSTALAPLNNSIQNPPLYLAGSNVDFGGQALGKIQPQALKTLFPRLNNKDKLIREIRDTDLKALNDALKSGGSRKQREWLDDHVRSQDEVRQLQESLIDRFSSINNNGASGSIDAALIAFKLNITSVATFMIGFGNDNHNDPNLAGEARATVGGCKTMANMFKRMKAEDMEDKVTFASVGVFGRTLGKVKNGNGRDHNLNHHVTIIAGKNVKAGVVGGMRKVGNDFGATAINSRTGEGTSRGDIPLADSLESVAKTIGAACGIPAAAMNKRIKRAGPDGDSNVGKIITAAVKV